MALGPFLCMYRVVHLSSPQTEGIQSCRWGLPLTWSSLNLEFHHFPIKFPIFEFPNFWNFTILLYFLYNYFREEISLSFHKCMSSLVLRSCKLEKVYQLVNNMQSVEGLKILQILEFAIYQCSRQPPDFQKLATLQGMKCEAHMYPPKELNFIVFSFLWLKTAFPPTYLNHLCSWTHHITKGCPSLFLAVHILHWACVPIIAYLEYPRT